MFYPREFKYDAQHDIYVCPFNKVLTLKTVDRRGYRQYKTDVKHCESCPLKQRCTLSKQKIIHRHIWQDYVDELDAHRLTPQGKKIYKRRKETVERSFADSKEMHGLRYTRFRSLAKVRGQCLLVAACQNMKKSRLYCTNKRKCLVLRRALIRSRIDRKWFYCAFKPYFQGLQRAFSETTF